MSERRGTQRGDAATNAHPSAGVVFELGTGPVRATDSSVSTGWHFDRQTSPMRFWDEAAKPAVLRNYSASIHTRFSGIRDRMSSGRDS
jgi:hypothetical protein